MEHPMPKITAVPEEPDAGQDAQRQAPPVQKPDGPRGGQKPPLPGLPDDMEVMPQIEED